MRITYSGLIKSEFYKYRKSGIYYASFFAMIAYSIVFAMIFPILEEEAEVGTCILNVLSNSIFMNMLIAVLGVPFAIGDFQFKTIQHTLTLGASRNAIINAKLLIISATFVCAYVVAIGLGAVSAIALCQKGFEEISFCFVLFAVLAELVFIIVFLLLCMLFYIIVRNSAAYIMAIFALWFSMFGSLAGSSFENPILNFMVKFNIFGQNHLMICQRMGTQIYSYTMMDWIQYLFVMVFTGVILYLLIRTFFNKIELR